jgi:hypothetical protein
MTEVTMTPATIAEPLTIEGIRRHLGSTTDRHLYLFAEVGSTNDCQRAGRGRVGQRWTARKSPASSSIAGCAGRSWTTSSSAPA